ncbi:MAG: C_GCAxxG_C_C family protein [Firmicutes bacterium]|jgi:C_GCAxxG_C_C family probable redox protein|nr:C_GCAxxG_C_C family protein [Bacillota bacterium]
MKDKERCIQRARELACEYQGTLVGCAHCSFSAVMDALREEGIELVSPEIQNEMFKSVIGLTGGCGNMHIGTCGAVFGASYAISLATGIGREEQEKDGKWQRWISYYNVKDGIGDKFIDEFNSIICRDILLSRFGMSFDSQYPGRNKELFNLAEKVGCRNPQDCVISKAAAYAVERIWDLVKNPEDQSWVWKKHEPTADVTL